MRFSVIIPALNEAGIVSRCIAHIRSLNPEAEIIVADGGSLDNTVAIARKAGICTVASEQSRGIQCNAGAALASGDVLVFLHTDTELPADAFRQLEEYFNNDSVQIGTFRLSFDFNHWLLKLYCLPCELNIAFTRFGDQCIVVRKSFFGSIGGFPNWRLFEDLTLINKARKKTRIYRFPGKIRTSARRFLKNGILRQQLLNIWLIILYFLGISPDKLARKYEQTTYNWHKFSLVVFARYPRLGKVKTRLAQSLGDEQATELYRLCAEQVFHVCEKFSSRARLYVSFDKAEDVAKGAVWAGPRFDSVAQIQGDLGQRLEHAISTTFNQNRQKVLVLASDVPDISCNIIKDAVRALNKHDIVVGPSCDGGYYLIGMKDLYPELFIDISWGSQYVYGQTLDTINRLGLKVYELPKLIDIDTCKDLSRWLAEPERASNRILSDYAQSIIPGMDLE